jgi:hypothetical protein
MKHRYTLLAILALASAPVAHAETSDAPEKNPRLDVEGMSCRYLLESGGSERDLLLAFLHGYVAGKSAGEAQDVVEMAETTDRVIGWCIDNPGQTVIKSFAEARGDQ